VERHCGLVCEDGADNANPELRRVQWEMHARKRHPYNGRGSKFVRQSTSATIPAWILLYTRISLTIIVEFSQWLELLLAPHVNVVD